MDDVHLDGSRQGHLRVRRHHRSRQNIAVRESGARERRGRSAVYDAFVCEASLISGASLSIIDQRELAYAAEAGRLSARGVRRLQ